MLVLSRNEKQKVVFKNLGISVSIASIKGNKVRLGIDAPKDVEILRDELASPEDMLDRRLPIDRHAIRNRLNTIMLSLHIIARSSVVDQATADDEIRDALHELAQLNEVLTGAPSSTATDLPAPTPKPKSLKHGDEKRTRRALVVEDNEHERSLLAAYLKLSGYEVTEVSDGNAAIGYLEQHTLPDIVLLDMNMPKLNGAKTVSKIRHTPGMKDVKVFGVSGSNRIDWDIPLGDRGVDSWFQKPVNPEAIVQQINEITCC